MVQAEITMYLLSIAYIDAQKELVGFSSGLDHIEESETATWRKGTIINHE